jgi:predicted MFS family arabinose efflux permease
VLTIIRAARNLFGQELVIPHWRTSSQGAAMLGLAFGLAAAGTVGGQIIQAWGFNFLFLAGAVATLLSAACLFGYLQHTSRLQAERTLARPL